MKSTLFLITALVSGLAFAGGASKGGSNEQGSSQGQPFRTVNETMDEMRQALEQQLADAGTSTQNQIDCLNDYLNGTVSAADPSACPDYSGSRLEELEHELTELELQMVSVSQEFASASCPDGYTLATLNPVSCVASGAASSANASGQLSTTQAIGGSGSVFYKQYRTKTVNCPDGYQVTGCSFLASPTVNVYSSSRAGNACTVSAYGFPGTGLVRAVAHCSRVE